MATLLTFLTVTFALFLSFKILSRFYRNNRVASLLKQDGRGKSVVVTGAGSGVGKATSLLFLERNWKVFALDVNEKGLEDLQTSARVKGVDASLLTLMTCDLQSVDAMNETCAEITNILTTKADKTEGGKLDALINCAGVSFAAPCLGLSQKLIDLQIKVNTIAPLVLTRQLFPLLLNHKNKDHGVVVNVSSIGGIRAWPFQGAYSVSKFGLEGLTDILRREMLGAGLGNKVKFVSVNPGGLDTPMSDSMHGFFREMGRR